MAGANPALAAAVTAYVVGLTAYGLAIGSDVVVPYLVLVVGAVVLVCHLEVRVGLGRVTLWGLAAWGLGHLAGGIVPIGGGRVLYNAVLGVELFHVDRIVHAWGFGFATLACGMVIRRWLPGGRVGFGAGVVIVLAGLGVGALNEIVEFGATLVLEDTNVGGYVNTGWDLVFDLGGGIVATLWLARRSRVAVSPGRLAPSG